MTFFRSVRWAAAWLCLAPLGACAAGTVDLHAAASNVIRPLMARYGIPGMAVAVTVDGRTTFLNYGNAFDDAATPVSERTLFELGSVSKTFTATLACYAQVQGKLSLLDHPGQTMPALKGSPVDRASLRDLGTYSAGGLPLQFPDDVETAADMLAYFRDWKPDAAPAVQRRYSNPSIGLMGQAAALALRADFVDVVEQQMLPAFGMRYTYIRMPDGAMSSYAWGQDKTGQRARVSPGVLDAQTYGVKSNAADMIRYLQLQMNPAALPRPWRQAVACTHEGHYRTGEMVQGLGWEQYRGIVTPQRLVAGNSDAMAWEPHALEPIASKVAPPGTWFNKTGSTRGFGAYALFNPQRRTGIVLLANKNYPNAARVEAAYAILTLAGSSKP